MSHTNIQISLDIATAFSVIGAAIAFIVNSIREGIKERVVRNQEFALEKTSNLIEFLSKKTIESSLIIQNIDDIIDYANIDLTLLEISKTWDTPFNYPDVLNISQELIRLSNDILNPIKVHLTYYPYIGLLPKDSQEIVKNTITEIEKYIWDRKGTSIIQFISMEQHIHRFFDYIIENKIIDLGDNDVDCFYREQLAMEKFQELDEIQKLNVKYAFLRMLKNKVLEHQKFWHDVPLLIENSAKALISSQSFRYTYKKQDRRYD